VSSPFGFGKRSRTEKLLGDIRARLDEMESRFSRVEESLSRPEARQQEARQQPQIQIENVHIHQPVLEKLEFRLDALDIEQLSGSLNLGNNFGTKPAIGREPGNGAAPGRSPGGASGPAAGKSASAAARGRSETGAGGTGGSASAKSRSEAGRGGTAGDDGANAAAEPDAGDGLRRTRSGYRWNNRR